MEGQHRDLPGKDFVYKYHRYLRERTQDFPKHLRFCDGGMQRYLEQQWSKESNRSELFGRITKMLP